MAVVESQERLDPNSPKDGGENQPTEAQATPPQKDEPTPPAVPKEETPAVKPEVPEDHPTKLGRKVKFLEDSLTTVLNKFDTLISRMESGQTGPAAPAHEEPGQVPTYVRETVEYLSKQQKVEQEQQRKYADGYIAAIRKGEDDIDDDVHAAVEQELLETNFRLYEKHTGDPVRDAKLNYNIALAKILKQRTSKGKPNVKGDQETSPTKLSSNSSNAEPAVKRIEPDEFVLKYCRVNGLDPYSPEIQESLKNAK